MKKLQTTPQHQVFSNQSTQSLKTATNQSFLANHKFDQNELIQQSPLSLNNNFINKSFNGLSNQSSYRNQSKKQCQKTNNLKRDKTLDSIPKSNSRPLSQLNQHNTQNNYFIDKNKSNGILDQQVIKTALSNINTSNLSTMRNGVIIKQGSQRASQDLYKDNAKNMKYSPNKTIFSDISNRQNVTCIILKSNEKQYISPQKEYNDQSICEFGQRLEEIEADAQALKRSMLSTSKDSYQTTQENTMSFAEYKICKRSLAKTSAKYQALLKEFSTQQHQLQTKEMQLQKLNNDITDVKNELQSKDNLIKQLKFENDKLFNECSIFKTNSSYQQVDKNMFQGTNQILELEQENFRKKVKRLTGELDVLETYYDSLQVLLKQNLPQGTQQTSNKLFRSLNDSIEYIRDLFTNTKLNVSQGKRVQRKIRYEKLKTEFQTLIIQLCQSYQKQIDNVTSNSIQQNQQESYKQQIQVLKQQQEKDKQEHNKRIDQYKEQVVRMRENIDLFKENMKLLKNQNEELQSKVNNHQCNNENLQMQSLFNGLKEDNERLVEELKRLQDENYQLHQYLGVSKETIQNQNGVIQGLQSVIESYQQVNSQDNRSQNFITTRKYQEEDIHERSKSCNSSVEQHPSRIKPLLLHQSLVFKPSKQQTLKHYQSTQNDFLNINPITTHNDLVANQSCKNFQRQQQLQQIKRSASSISQRNLIKHTTQQFNGQFNEIQVETKPTNQTLNISNYNNNILNKSSVINDVTQQEQSQFLQESFIKYLAADQKNQDNQSQLDISQQIHVQGLLEVCGSPMTARFSSFQNQLQKQGKVSISPNDISRENIKQNTKNLQGEIQDLDEEIFALQNTLFNAFSQTKQQIQLNQSNIDNKSLNKAIDFDVSHQTNNINDFSLLHDQEDFQ